MATFANSFRKTHTIFMPDATNFWGKTTLFGICVTFKWILNKFRYIACTSAFLSTSIQCKNIICQCRIAISNL